MKWTQCIALLGLMFASLVILAGQEESPRKDRKTRFTSTDGTFYFEYPASFAQCGRNPNQPDRWGPDESCEAFIPVCSDFSGQSDGTVTCIAYPAERMKGTNFQAAAFSVSVVPETPGATTGGDMETGGGLLFALPKPGAVAVAARARTLTIRGEIPTEVWNRLGRTLIPKLKTGNELVMKLDVSVQVESDTAQGFQQELMQILRDLNLGDAVKIEIE